MLGKKLIKAAAGAGGVEKDEYFNQTTLLLHGDGTNGAQNNTFLDSSSNTFTITRNGNTTQGTFSPFSEGWSNYFDGTGDYLTAADSAELEFSGDFTVEGFFYYTGTAANLNPATIRVQATGAITRFELNNGSTYLPVAGETTQPTASRTTFTGVTVTPNTWVHIAWVRSSNVIKAYVNGVASATTQANSVTTQRIRQVGTGGGLANGFLGYISSFRMVGSALYTANFTPPTAFLTAVSGTRLLTCQSNRFIDNSTNAFAITPTNNVAVQPFSPFAPSAAYSPSVNGGSGYFDGTGDNLQTPSNSALALGTGEFLLEFWYYSIDNTAPTYRNAFYASESAAAGGLCVFTDDASIMYLRLYGTADYTWTPGPRYQWNHIVVTRSNSSSSNELSVYQNGVRVVNATQAFNVTQSQARIGSYFNGTYADMFGYISGLRVQKGAGYTGATYTVPTAPPTSDANTSLLLNFTNAGIYDSTAKNNLETVGNAQVDTSVVKYGTGSMEFDGNGDSLMIPNNGNFVLGNTATIQFWIYQRSRGANLRILYTVNNLSGIDCYVDTNGLLRTHGSLINSTYTVPLNTWVYVSLVYNAGTLTIYVNGTSYGSGSGVNITSTNPLYVGSLATTAGYYWNGYIDDLRITKGIARDGTVVPDKAFPDQ